MTVQHPLFKKSMYLIVEQIFTRPHKTFHLRGLAKNTGLSTTATKNAIKELENAKIITVEKTDITTQIKANLDSHTCRYSKQTVNIYRLYRSLSLPTIRDELHTRAVILFGSYARAEDSEKSDIDLLFITNRKINRRIERLLEKAEQHLRRKINVHLLPTLDKSTPEFRNAAAKGIVLDGYLLVAQNDKSV